MRWIFFLFQGITELNTQNKEKIWSEILNMKDIHWKILSLWEKNVKIYIIIVNLPNLGSIKTRSPSALNFK